MNQWIVYLLECSDHTYYTGITTDLERRLSEHNGSSRGARYTRARQPVTLVYSEQQQDRSAASAREYQIRKLSRAAKQALIASCLPVSTVTQV
ncbi:MAG TPA: GIY-YIG nuclease family protein [Dongiaceae bacterium]|nr:GIY-YIG nuclease family protein [Dongiaceae bacterium]